MVPFKNQVFRVQTLDPARLPGRSFILHGGSIHKRADFFQAAAELFCFPYGCEDSLDALADWMTDLSWFPDEQINVVIDSAEEFLSEDRGLRKTVTDIFAEDILPFWESEVENVTVEGKAKRFDLYLVKETVQVG